MGSAYFCGVSLDQMNMRELVIFEQSLEERAEQGGPSWTFPDGSTKPISKVIAAIQIENPPICAAPKHPVDCKNY